MGHGPYAAVGGLWGLLEAPWAQFCWGPRIGPEPKLTLQGLDPLMGSRTIKILASPKLQARTWWTDSDILNLLLAYSSVVSSKLTELTESSPSAPPPSVLCGSGIFSQLSSPSMASSGHFDSSQTYDGYRAGETLDPACTECLSKGKDCFQPYNPLSSKCHYCIIGKKPCCCTGVSSSNVRRYLWSRKDGPFGKEFPVSEAHTPDGTSGFSQ
ncbi:hypothetical protein O181_119142, partial [Austropuccinia psidii MF-1]|nr:hypothetical protein [Austropuccinia psidii MF-1]